MLCRGQVLIFPYEPSPVCQGRLQKLGENVLVPGRCCCGEAWGGLGVCEAGVEPARAKVQHSELASRDATEPQSRRGCRAAGLEHDLPTPALHLVIKLQT